MPCSAQDDATGAWSSQRTWALKTTECSAGRHVHGTCIHMRAIACAAADAGVCMRAHRYSANAEAIPCEQQYADKLAGANVVPVCIPASVQLNGSAVPLYNSRHALLPALSSSPFTCLSVQVSAAPCSIWLVSGLAHLTACLHVQAAIREHATLRCHKALCKLATYMLPLCICQPPACMQCCWWDLRSRLPWRALRSSASCVHAMLVTGPAREPPALARAAGQLDLRQADMGRLCVCQPPACMHC